jgi:hypothetical protein
MSATPGSILPGGIVLMDEPASIGLTTFSNNGEVLLTFNARPGGNCGQIILGLTPNMALQLRQALDKYGDVCARWIAEGKGGASFTEKP